MALFDIPPGEADLPPGWQPMVDGSDRVVPETSGSIPGLTPQGSAGVLVGGARELLAPFCEATGRSAAISTRVGSVPSLTRRAGFRLLAMNGV